MAKDRFYFVVNWRDDYILHKGSLKDCEYVMNNGFDNLSITTMKNLTPGMKANWNKKMWNTPV